jgi:hypothetical protein
MLPDFEAEDEMMEGEYLWQIVEIVFGGVPTLLEVRFICLFMSHGRKLLQVSVSTNMFHKREIQWIVGKLKTPSNSLETSILGLIKSWQAFLSLRLLDGTYRSAFVSLSTLRFFTSSVLRALGLAFSFCPVHPSTKTSLNL